LEYFAKNR